MDYPPLPDPKICEYAIPDNGITVPLLLDLPHGGGIYPDDFGFSCPRRSLELCEERFLDILYTPPATQSGGAVIKANFPRTYVDTNRAVNDIDQLLFKTPWMEPTLQNGRSIHGHGVVMRLIRPEEPIYSRMLSHHEVRTRLDVYYSAYHTLLNSFSNKMHETFGVVYHLNCHSMPSSVLASNFPHLQPDFILGDKDGRSCGLNVRNQVADILKSMGYRVAINQLYKGAEIISRYGQPAWGRHSLQIEINRALFVNEQTGEMSNNFSRIKEDIQKLIAELSDLISH